VVRVNAHNHFFDGTICTAPAGNRACASSERFKLDFCEKGVRRCAWLAAFAGQPRLELTDPFVEDYRPVIEETPPEAGDVAVLWAATDAGNELVGLWRVLALAPARRGWVLNGDRDAAVLLPKGVVPWSAVYRRWSSPRGSQSLRTLDATGLEGLLVEVRDHLAPLAAEQPGVQRDLAALEVMLADQRARQADAPTGDGAGGDGAKIPVVASPRKGKRAAKTPEPPPENLHARLRARGGFYTPTLVAQYEMAAAESRLVILAGPSGTGKTRLAGEAAAELGAAFCLVAVRPDWHANEDLLGYLPPFPGARFSSTPASQFIVAAAADPGRPYHLCLDEMNLARPEHYLAELLSKMEIPGGRVAFHTGGDEEAGFPTEVAYPANLVVVGTVNLNETTQPVSAKILDRAAYLVVEAGELKAFLDHLPEAATVPPWVPRLLVDLDGSLDDAGQGLGYRAAGRLVRWAVMGAARGHAPEEALDWALSAQVLPRLRFSRSDPAHRTWAGAGALADPAGRARIWADLAPRVPKRDEERALVAIALLRRALPAFVALHRAPVTASTSRREWATLERTGGRRLLMRRLHPFDPPRPPEAPRFGQVATLARERSPDTPENRFVVGVVRRLLSLVREATAEEALVDTDLANELVSSARALQLLAGEAPWAQLSPGPAPRVSFLLRDQPHYRAFSDALDDSLHFSPLPGDPVALGLRTQTLNALFEVWVAQALRAAVRRRLGLPVRPGAPLPRGGAEEATTARGRVWVAFDRVYPRRGEGIVALGRKRSPDAAVEWWPAGGQPVVMAVDATWSRNATYHDDKLGYARSLAHGEADPMTGAPRLCARRCLVVFPGPRPRVNEIGFALSLATVSAPPSEAGWSLIGSFLDRALEGVVPSGLSAAGFVEVADLAARPSLC
jgi:hypothetical protein